MSVGIKGRVGKGRDDSKGVRKIDIIWNWFKFNRL